MKTDWNRTLKRQGRREWNALVLGLFALNWLGWVGVIRAAPIDRCNIIVADSQATVYQYDPQTGKREIIAQGGALIRPYDVVLDNQGNIVVSDTGSLKIVRVNPFTRAQSILAEGAALGVPFGLAVDQHDCLYIANSRAVLCLNAKAARLEVFAEAEFLQVPLDVAVAADGNVYVADAVAGVIRIDQSTRAQTVIAKDKFVRRPIGMAIDGNRSLYVADADARCVVEINLQNNTQRMLSETGFLATPVAIAIGPGGTVLVSDPDAFDLDGGVLSIGPNGGQTPILRGFGDLVNPRGIAVVAVSTNASENPRRKR